MRPTQPGKAAKRRSGTRGVSSVPVMFHSGPKGFVGSEKDHAQPISRLEPPPQESCRHSGVTTASPRDGRESATTASMAPFWPDSEQIPTLNIPAIPFGHSRSLRSLLHAHRSPIPTAGGCEARQPRVLCQHQAAFVAGIPGFPLGKRGWILPHTALSSPGLFQAHWFLHYKPHDCSWTHRSSLTSPVNLLNVTSHHPLTLCMAKSTLTLIHVFFMHLSAGTPDTAPCTQTP